MNSNPEWTRNIWSELSRTRIILMPAVLMAIYFIIALTADTRTDFFENAYGFSIGAAGVLLFFWGAKITSEAVISEMNNRTWSQQRLSQITPLEMTIGKLFGSSVFPWYGALIALVVALVSTFFIEETLVKLRIILNLVLSGILVQSLTLNFSLMGVKKNRDSEKMNSGFYYIFTIIVSMFIFSMGVNMMDEMENTVKWFFWDINTINFSLYSLVFFTAWSVIGAYQNMRTELQFINGAAVWYAFLITIMLYFSGVIIGLPDVMDDSIILVALYAMGALVVVVFYYLIFNESKTLSDLRNTLAMLMRKDWKALGMNAPLYMLTFPVMVLLAIAAAGYHFAMVYLVKSADASFSQLSFVYPLSILLFVIRDLALIYYQNLQRRSDRADVATLVYLILMYGLLPALFNAMELHWVAYFFYPDPESPGVLLFFAPIVQFAFVFYFLYKAWLKANLEIVEAD